MPELDEVAEEWEIGRLLGNSPRRAFANALSIFSSDDFEMAQKRRRGELFEEFALAEFEQKSFFKYLPISVQRDITEHFENYTKLRKVSSELLYSLGDTAQRVEACLTCSQNGLGYMFNDRAFQFHPSVRDKLPVLLRVYLRCAERLYGGFEQFDLLKIHLRSSKLSLLRFDDFDGARIPKLVERIKIRLRERDYHVFEYGEEFPPTPLLYKSFFIPETHPNFEEQSKFDEGLLSLNIFPVADTGPTMDEFRNAMKSRGFGL